ncbi:hypothetical protein B0H14DRAFT_2667229 [Mycena olivaceomarginata]|nr:hypothetical protein B0H14DRAFT_2667229 [Mycena olivaceomarginata]
MEKDPPEGPIPVLDTPGDEPCAKIWSVYISEAEKYDKALADSWRGNMNGMLIFAGLFSAILTAFIIESYKNLQPGHDMDSLGLACIVQQIANTTGSIPAVLAFMSTQNLPCEKLAKVLESPAPDTSSLVCNILWFISLGLSLASALTATLVEQWAREFLQRTEMLPSPVKRARIFTFLYYGLQRFRMHAVVGLIPLLLHLSLLFFFGGLVAFLIDVNRAVAYVAAGLLAVIFILYGYVTVLPLIQFDCPYKTPLSNVFWNVRRYFLRRLAFYQGLPDDAHDELPLSLEGVNLHRRSMVNAMIAKATVRSIPREERDNRALVWTMKSLADDDELEPFVEGIPSAIWGPQGRRRKYDNLFRGLLSNPQVQLGSRIEHLMLSCESGLLEPMVKTRREISCLKAIWCLGMMAEKGKEGEDPNSNPDSNPLAPPPPNPAQPLNFLQGLRFLPPETEVTARYLPSIAALVDWNNLCSLYGHVKKLEASLQIAQAALAEAALAEGRLPDLKQLRLEVEGFLAERQRCKWAYLVPISYLDLNLDELVNADLAKADLPFTLHAASNWIQNVSQIITIVPTSFNSVQYRVLLSYLQRCTDLDKPPYEFDLTVQTLQAGLEPVNIPVGLAVATFCDNVRKAVQMQISAITHNDTVIATLLPWVDKANGLDIEMVERVNDSGMKYINNRNSSAAVCRALRDSDLTRVWERITGRLETCRPDLLGDYSKAMWNLAFLFPGLSTPGARLSDWPKFNPSTLSVAPVAPYSASVIALLKTHILNAYEKAYQTKELSSHLQALETQLRANKQPSALHALMVEVRRIEGDWGLITAVLSLMLQFPTMGKQPLPQQLPLPTYTIQTLAGYQDWHKHTLAAVSAATELLPRLDRRTEEARLAITAEFMLTCSSDVDLGLPFNAVDTFDNLSTNLFINRPVHSENQRNFALAFHTLAEGSARIASERTDHPRLLQAIISSPLFNDSGLPWLNDSTAISAIQNAVKTLRAHLTFGFEDGATSRKLDDIGNWLDLKLHDHPLK